MEENTLIARCQKGELEFFGGFFDAYNRKIYDFLYFRTHHKPTAEDLTSLIFIKAMDRIRQFDSSKGKFSTWLYQIARNTLIDHFRTFKSTENIEDIWDLPSSANVERDADTMLLLEKVQAQIRQLPALQRDIVVMRLWDGLSHQEISSSLGMTEGNSKVQFARAIIKLRAGIGLAGLIAIVVL